MTPAEKKAVEAVVRAAKRWEKMESGWCYMSDVVNSRRQLTNAVRRLLREEAKREKRRGK